MISKLNTLILIAFCFSVCYANECTDFYQAIDETTGQTIVEGFLRDSLYQDSGEYRVGGEYSSYVTELGDGVYQVQGSYNIYINLNINHRHLCTLIYIVQKQTDEIFYQFIRTRDPSRIGQQYTQDEVSPDINEQVQDLLQEIIVQAIKERKSDYIIRSIAALSNKRSQ